MHKDARARAYMRSACRRHGGTTVVGEAEDGWSAVEIVRSLQPDAVILDGPTQPAPTRELTKMLRAERPDLVVAVVGGVAPADSGALDIFHTGDGGILPALVEVHRRLATISAGTGDDGTAAADEPSSFPPPSLRALGPDQLDRILGLALRHLNMDAAVISAFTGGRQIYEVAAGDPTSFGMGIGSGPALEDSYCQRMVDGDIPGFIPDSSRDERVRSLRTTIDGRIGSYIGVPISLPDGSLYGTFCCVGHDANPTLDARDVDFLRLLGELVSEHIEVRRGQEVTHQRIRQLIDGRDVHIALQPIVDLIDGRCLGVEALSRFGPAWGSPDEVFTAAMEVGLGVELESLAAAKALELLPRLSADQYLSINMSPHVALAVAELADDTIPFDRVVFEVTEHAAITTYVELRDVLAPLREKGLRVAVDDAGAGFASLKHIVELAPDMIKVDRSLIEGLADSPARRSVVSAFAALAGDLGATLVAEGLETPGDLAAAVALGVDAGQGYLLARPSQDERDHLRWALEGFGGGGPDARIAQPSVSSGAELSQDTSGSVCPCGVDGR